MKNIQIISRLVAREHNYDVDEVEDVNNFFWKEVRKAISSMQYTSISIKHFGTITVSKRKVDQLIKTLIRKIRNIRKSKRYKESTISLLLDTNFDKLRKALYQRNILAKQYYENYTKRTSRIREATSLSDSQSSSSTGGNLESSEGRVWDVEGGGETGNSEETVNMFDVPVS